ncbi:putative sulfate/molybdate transporter [Leptospira bouyouniensis]|uniref:putative sulfate/molybdate transporter n=1 Tax=Leptospira bouyouniensis TaxID=2484911 RepID=UPI001FD0A9F8|nr:putative sulfate/molybdate transporter [Leptospira bouyouniensis]
MSILAFKEYIPSESTNGYILSAISFLFIILLIDNKKIPASLVVIIFGFLYSLISHFDTYSSFSKFEVNIPKLYVPNLEFILKGFILLTLPQIPLSIGNSILATKQISDDLFPNKKPITIKKIGLSYSIMNLISPFFSGIPCCHGAGGMVGHYTFGGRTGVSVLLYGLFYLLSGLFLGNGIKLFCAIYNQSTLEVWILSFQHNHSIEFSLQKRIKALEETSVLINLPKEEEFFLKNINSKKDFDLFKR